MKPLLFFILMVVARQGTDNCVTPQQPGDKLSAECIVQLLSKEWKYLKSNINGMYFNASPRQQNDRLRFYPDMTFERVENGTSSRGRWSYNSEKQKIILHYESRTEVQQLSIEQASTENLVLKFEEDWRFDMTIYLTSDEASIPCPS